MWHRPPMRSSVRLRCQGRCSTALSLPRLLVRPKGKVGIPTRMDSRPSIAVATPAQVCVLRVPCPRLPAPSRPTERPTTVKLLTERSAIPSETTPVAVTLNRCSSPCLRWMERFGAVGKSSLISLRLASGRVCASFSSHGPAMLWHLAYRTRTIATVRRRTSSARGSVHGQLRCARARSTKTRLYTLLVQVSKWRSRLMSLRLALYKATLIFAANSQSPRCPRLLDRIRRPWGPRCPAICYRIIHK